MKSIWDTEDQFGTILDYLWRYCERESSQSIILDILLPPGYCLLKKNAAIKSMYFQTRRSLIDCWTFNVLKHIVQWLVIEEGWKMPIRKEVDTKSDGNLFENSRGNGKADDSKGRMVKRKHGDLKEKETPCDGERNCVCEVRKVDLDELAKIGL